MMNANFKIREAKNSEYEALGDFLTDVYSRIPGYPSKEEQPDYYATLQNIGTFAEKPGTFLLVAVTAGERIIGGVVYFKEMQYYGSGGSATLEKETSGFRLLAVHPEFRGNGLGKTLCEECIQKAKRDGNKQVIIHSTKYMQASWRIYEKLGFHKSPELDFDQDSMPVFGFRLHLA